MKVRAIVCGGDELRSSASALGIVVADAATADLALIDLRDPSAVGQAAILPRELARVAVIDDAQRDIVAALGIRAGLAAASCEPAVLGPLIAAALPPSRRRATRSVLITSVRGGSGCSLLAANLCRRLAPVRSTLALDTSGGIGLSWWLGATAAGWHDLEDLSDELTAEHLAVVALEAAPGLRIAGGPPDAPSVAVCRAAVRAALELVEFVVIDGASVAEERTRELAALVDRALVVTYDDPASVAALTTAEIPQDAWIIASQSLAATIGGHEVFRALPRAEHEVAAAASGPRAVGGRLGAAYDELAELLVIDAS